ncbi:hypothetical protein F5887DRAFT_995048 [Amanita rubescens]|nr:hypothetical protein F5887DRAFT_995048 [Amanita rubescens]
MIMLFFYALLFVLFGTSVIAAPVQGGSRASVPVPTDGTYWFPKTPPSRLPPFMWNRVLLIEDKQYSLLALNEEFQIIKSSKQPVTTDKWPSLAGVWAPIPTSKTAQVHPLGELIISAESTSHGIDLKFFPTPPADNKDQLDNLMPSNAYAPKSRLGAQSNIVDGYWVLGDAPKDAFEADNWRDILEIKDGKYYTFRVDPQFGIIGSKREVKALSRGNYYAVPYARTNGTKHRFLALKVRRRRTLAVLEYQVEEKTLNPGRNVAVDMAHLHVLNPHLGIWI